MTLRVLLFTYHKKIKPPGPDLANKIQRRVAMLGLKFVQSDDLKKVMRLFKPIKSNIFQHSVATLD